MTKIAEEIKQTEDAFPPQPTGAVAECPFKAKEAKETSMPIAAKTAYQITQQMAQTMNVIGGESNQEEKQKDKDAWIEIILVGEDGKPIPNERYKITSPTGEIQEGRLNEHGQAGYYKIEPGNCKVTFPDLDKDAWE